MTYLRLALGLVLAIAIILYFIRPAEPQAGLNVISYDGSNVELNGRSTTEAELRAMDFPPGAEIMVNLTDAKHTNLGAQAGLIYHWDKIGLKHYFSLDGVPLRVDTITWRPATEDELKKEIEAENFRRQSKADLRRKEAEAEAKEPKVATFEDEAPPDRSPEEEYGFVPFQPEDTNRYYWNGKLLGTAAQAEHTLKQVRLTRPGALLVITPKSDSPPAKVKSVEALGFPPVVTELLKRAGSAGIFVRLHRGQGFAAPDVEDGSLGIIGGFFYAYLGPLILIFCGVFLVSWFMEGGRAQHER